MKQCRELEERFCDASFNVIHPCPISSPTYAKKIVFATTDGNVALSLVQNVPSSPFKGKALDI